jgi:hypothetical protein
VTAEPSGTRPWTRYWVETFRLETNPEELAAPGVEIYLASEVDATLAAKDKELAEIGMWPCDKCGIAYPQKMLAIETENGAPIDVEKFTWCITCHNQRHHEKKLAALRQSVETIQAKIDGFKNGANACAMDGTDAVHVVVVLNMLDACADALNRILKEMM